MHQWPLGRLLFFKYTLFSVGAVISVKKYNPVSPFPEFYDTWELISQDKTKIGWICGACIREPWKGLWVPYRLEGMLELWRLDKQIGLDICGFSSAGKETNQSHLLPGFLNVFPTGVTVILGAWCYQLSFTDGWTWWDSERCDDLGHPLTVRAKIWTQASWLQVCGPSTALQLLPEPLSWVIQAKQASFLLFEGGKCLVGTDWLTEVDCSLWFISPGHPPNLCFLLCRHRSEAFWPYINSLCDPGWIIFLSGL